MVFGPAATLAAIVAKVCFSRRAAGQTLSVNHKLTTYSIVTMRLPPKASQDAYEENNLTLRFCFVVLGSHGAALLP
eukprot:5458222-Amphidinium_carterae.1